MAGPIVFFDGNCGLCNGFVDFLLRRDRREVFQMSPLQGETAARLLPKGLPDTVVLLKDGHTWVRSEAVIRILQGLGGFWRLSLLARIVPRGCRDALYNWVAARRYGWFGKREQCRLPSPGEHSRFLP